MAVAFPTVLFWSGWFETDGKMARQGTKAIDESGFRIG
jgi:hypothetical protein